jgi:hypothetical protein
MLSAIDDPELKNAFFKEKLIDKFFNKPVQSEILEDAILETLQQ